MYSSPRVLIVEDEPAIAELLTVNLKHSGFTPIWAAEGVAAQRELDLKIPDLILLDWMLPGQSGLSLARKWRSESLSKDIPIILLTARGDELDKLAGLDSGADDYITKPFSVKELLARMRAILRRRLPETNNPLLSIGDLKLDSVTHRVSYKDTLLKLGPTEYKLLQHFMTFPERVHSRSQLLDQVWGNQVFIEDRTVDVHVKRLRESLGSGCVHIETVRGIGYRMTALIATDSIKPNL